MSRPSHRWIVLALAGLLLGLYVLSAAFFVVYREINVDEGWYLMAAREVTRGRFLYADFAYPQGPGLPYVYGLLLMPFGFRLLAGRILTALLGVVGAGLVAWLAARLPADGETKGDARAGLLALALLASLPYTIAHYTSTATYSLAALLLAVALLAASVRWREALWAAVAMMTAIAAAGTRISVAPAAVILAVYLVAVARRRLRVFLAVLAGAVAALAIVWGPFFLADPQAAYFNNFGFHTTEMWLSTRLSMAWGVLMGTVAEFPTVVLLLAGLGVAGFVSFWRTSNRRAWLRREALPLTVGAIVLAVGLAHTTPRSASAYYHNVIIPLACALGGYGLMRLWSAVRLIRGRQVLVALVTVLLGLGFVFQFTTCFDRLLLRPIEGGLNVSLARIAQAAAYADRHSARRPDNIVGKGAANNAPDAPWLAFSTDLAVDAQRDVLPGLEAGPPSYFRYWDTARCRQLHVVNNDILIEFLNDRSAGLVALTDEDFTRVGEGRDQILEALRAGYVPIRDFDRYGQAYNTLYLYTPRGQTEPVGGPSVPLEVRLGDDIAFLGYDLATETGSPVPPDVPLVVHPGDTLHLTLYWRCLRPIDKDLYVFNHLTPADGRAEMHGQEDGTPGHGWAPTSSWQVGEVIVDHWAVPVWPDAPAGEDTLAVGFYDLETGVRRPIFGPDDAPWGDHLLLGKIHIVR